MKSFLIPIFMALMNVLSAVEISDIDENVTSESMIVMDGNQAAYTVMINNNTAMICPVYLGDNKKESKNVNIKKSDAILLINKCHKILREIKPNTDFNMKDMDPKINHGLSVMVGGINIHVMVVDVKNPSYMQIGKIIDDLQSALK